MNTEPSSNTPPAAPAPPAAAAASASAPAWVAPQASSALPHPPHPLLSPPAASRIGAWLPAASLVAAAAAMALAWTARRDNQDLERELVRRQTEAQTQVTTALALARSADDAARDAQAKAALLEARAAEALVQRSQLESLMSSLSRTRDEHAVAEIESLLRSASQHASWTGRAESLVAAMKHADERLEAMNSPRLAAVRRALARDLERINQAASADGMTLAQRIDEVLMRVDDLPLVMQAPAASDVVPRGSSGDGAKRAADASAALPSRASQAQSSQSAPSPASSSQPPVPWRDRVGEAWQAWKRSVADEARALVRVSRVDEPAAMLLAPQQAYFVRENLKLRLLSARLALLSRQTDVALHDLRESRRSLDAYFDRQSQRVVSAAGVLEQVAVATRKGGVPRPDDTLAALAVLNP